MVWFLMGIIGSTLLYVAYKFYQFETLDFKKIKLCPNILELVIFAFFVIGGLITLLAGMAAFIMMFGIFAAFSGVPWFGGIPKVLTTSICELRKKKS